MSEVMGTFVGGRYGVARRGPETAQKITFKEAYQVTYVVAGTPYTDDLPTLPVWATDQASADAVDLTLNVYILYSVPLLGAMGPATLKLVTVTDYAALAALSDVLPLFLLHSSREQIYQAGSLGGGGGGGALVIEHGGAVVAAEPALNFIDGTGIVLTVADNPGSSRVDVTIDATISGGFTWILKTANYAMSSADSGILVDATAGNVVITLPSALLVNKLFAIKRIDNVLANTVTVNTGAGETIDDGSTAFLVRQYHGYVAGSDNNNWWLHSFFFPNPLTALGSMAAGDAAGVPTELVVGADDDELTANSAAPLGVDWEVEGGGTFAVHLAPDTSTPETGSVAVTGDALVEGTIYGELDMVVTGQGKFGRGVLSADVVGFGAVRAEGYPDTLASYSAVLGSGPTYGLLTGGATYTYHLTALDLWGGETAGFDFFAVTEPGTPVPIVLDWDPQLGLEPQGGWNVYRDGDFLEFVHVGTGTTNHRTYVDDGNRTPDGTIHPPSVNTTGVLAADGAAYAHGHPLAELGATAAGTIVPDTTIVLYDSAGVAYYIPAKAV